MIPEVSCPWCGFKWPAILSGKWTCMRCSKPILVAHDITTGSLVVFKIEKEIHNPIIIEVENEHS